MSDIMRNNPEAAALAITEPSMRPTTVPTGPARDDAPIAEQHIPATSSTAEVLRTVPEAVGATQHQMGQREMRRTDIASAHRPLTPEQLELFRIVAEDHFLVPFLEKRAHPPGAWGTDLPKRLSLDSAHRQVLDDYKLVRSGTTTWTELAAEHHVAVSTLTRRKSEAIDWLATARFILFRNPLRWNLSGLLRSHGDETVKAQLEAEADVQCDVFDQIQRSPFPPHFPVPLRHDDDQRLSNHHKDLLGWAARSLQGKRQLHLTAQSAIGKPSTIDLTPHLDLQPADEMIGSLEVELEQLHRAIQHYEVQAGERLQQLRWRGQQA